MITENNRERRGVLWTDNEVKQLLLSIQNRKSIREIADEHQRTTGGISAQLKKMTIKYWFDEKKSANEIEKLTGLPKSRIEFIIQTHNDFQENTNTSKNVEKNKIIDILSEINRKLDIIISNSKDRDALENVADSIRELNQVRSSLHLPRYR